MGPPFSATGEPRPCQTPAFARPRPGRRPGRDPVATFAPLRHVSSPNEVNH